MKVVQKTINYVDNLTINQIPFGQTCRLDGYDGYIMRVKPVNYLLNSTLVSDVINRNKCFVVNIETGNMFIVEGTRDAIRCHAETVVHG